jgi:hypothetical protein
LAPPRRSALASAGLWEASALLLEANWSGHSQRAVLEKWFPGPTPEATAAANLIVRLHDRLKEDPVRRQLLVRRLLAEYRVRYEEPDREWLRHLSEN